MRCGSERVSKCEPVWPISLISVQEQRRYGCSPFRSLEGTPRGIEKRERNNNLH